MTELTELRLGENKLSGSLPSEIAKLKHLQKLELNDNQLSTQIPSAVIDSYIWYKFWREIISQKEDYGFDLSGVSLVGPKYVVTDVNKVELNLSHIYLQHKYTVFLFWDPDISSSTSLIDKLVKAHQQKHAEGLEIVAYSVYNSNNYIQRNGMSAWKNFVWSDNQKEVIWPGTTPTAEVVDQNGNIVFSSSGGSYRDIDNRLGRDTNGELISFLESKFGKIDPYALYESIDYSKDGEVLTLQRAAVGDGIDLVILGDGFSDRDMAADGKYERTMRNAMEHFFVEEPFKTYRNRYNVYSVKAVSKNQVFTDNSETVFNCKYMGGNVIRGDNSKVYSYALKVPSITTNDNLTVITIVNSERYAGTSSISLNNDAAIAYCPLTGDDQRHGHIIAHEAAGHCFGKLSDEYSYPGAITQDAISNYKIWRSFGWGANVDITNDPAIINWAHILSDSRYDGAVSIYEGAMSYSSGIYRPTENSMMNHNTGGFNAPSREEIFNRIMRLSGESYDYEKFVDYDTKNRTIRSIAVRKSSAARGDSREFVPLSPPIIRLQ